MATQEEKDAAYHCGIYDLLKAAYRRDFDIIESGRCKAKYVTYNEWYATLNDQQKGRVEAWLDIEFYSDEQLRRFMSGDY